MRDHTIMSDAEIREHLKFGPRWFELGIIDEEGLGLTVRNFRASDDDNDEHWRYGAFMWFLKQHEDLTAEQCEGLFELGAEDPDWCMGQSMMLRVLERVECPAALRERAGEHPKTTKYWGPDATKRLASQMAEAEQREIEQSIEQARMKEVRQRFVSLLADLGFERKASASCGRVVDGNLWLVWIQQLQHEGVFRVAMSFIPANGGGRVVEFADRWTGGDSPAGRRFDFGIRGGDDVVERCLREIRDFVEVVAMPWFAGRAEAVKVT